jgi:hypothetical protein
MDALAIKSISTSTNSSINIAEEQSEKRAIINASVSIGIFFALLGKMDSQVPSQSEIANIRSIEHVLNQTYDLDNTTSNSIGINTLVVTSVEETQPRVMSLSEALRREEEIFADLQERESAARLAESEYWNFVNSDEG